MSEFKFSVIIPVYNAEKFVRKAVESALMQEETGEVILIEDKSPDNALDICRQLVDEHPDRVRLFRHWFGRNRGAGMSRNLGIKKAKFPYIAFLDADDVFLENRFANAKSIFTNDNSIDGVYGNVEVLKDNQIIEVVGIRQGIKPQDLFAEMGPIGSSGYFLMSAITIKKTVFKKTGGFGTFKIGEDTFLWMKLAILCKLVSNEDNRPIAQYIMHGANITLQSSFMMTELRPKLYFLLSIWGLSKKIKNWQMNAIISNGLYHSKINRNKKYSFLFKFLMLLYK
ncbi:MAG: glycosyltransferase family 2 protein [Bacteroidota bacterium]